MFTSRVSLSGVEQFIKLYQKESALPFALTVNLKVVTPPSTPVRLTLFSVSQTPHPIRSSPHPKPRLYPPPHSESHSKRRIIGTKHTGKRSGSYLGSIIKARDIATTVTM